MTESSYESRPDDVASPGYIPIGLDLTASSRAADALSPAPADATIVHFVASNDPKYLAAHLYPGAYTEYAIPAAVLTASFAQPGGPYGHDLGLLTVRVWT
jgi:hypothetical protein